MRDFHDTGGAGAGGGMGGSEADGSGAAEGDMDGSMCGSLALPPDLPPYSGDYIICDYMERLGTRLNVLETELKYAWRALDLLSQEYVRMWERIERLETLLADQQGVISTLLDFYTCRSGASRDQMTRLEVIREILGNGIEDGIEEGLDIGRQVLLDSQEEIMESDEAFYKSLNQAYRDDLVCEETSRPQSQLDMIWEAPEDNEIDNLATTSRQVYSASDYKDYLSIQGGSTSMNMRDLEHLTNLNTIDQMTFDKLHELDRITAQLHKDSQELQDLKSRVLKSDSKRERDIEAKVLAEDGNIINEQLKSVYTGSENIGINEMINSFDDFGLAIPKESTMRDKSPSRLSFTDSVTSDRNTDYMSSNVSPRRKYMQERSSEPYTTVTGRLAYSSAVANAEINAAKSKSPSALSRDRFDFSPYQVTEASKTFLGSRASFQPTSDVYKSQSNQSPVMSLHDTYRDKIDPRLSYHETRAHKSPSPPPPAPPNGAGYFTMPTNTSDQLTTHQPTLSASSILPNDNLRLSPRSPKSPKTSPKYLKKDCNNIVAAKSDSGLSSMSGWSSLEKSPGSPKTGKGPHVSHDHHKVRIASPQNILHKMTYESDQKPYLETLVDSYLYESTEAVKGEYYDKIAEHSKHQGSVENNLYFKNNVTIPNIQNFTKEMHVSDPYYRSDASSIYSVAGTRQPSFTTVYSSPRDMIADHRSFSELLDRNKITESTTTSNVVDTFPPEPSYHAETVVMPSAGKKPLTRANSMGQADPKLYQNGYKISGSKQSIPTNNLTDALTYYPTSTRYEFPKRTSLEDQLCWQGSSGRSPTNSMETMSIKSQSLSINERKQYQNLLQQEYYRQQQYDQRNGNMYENHGYENKQMNIDPAKTRKEQYSPSSALVSESGYLSISSDYKKKQDKSTKKPKRTSSLKTAMSSVSHWLPDLHLPKKHRSHSLPSGVDTVEPVQTEKSFKERLMSAQRRKKKYHIVASVSGLLQKARRKQASHQSLSDPETSETEWSGGRSSAQSEDSDSVFSDTAHENNMFVKINSKPRQRKANHQDIIEQQQTIQEIQQEVREAVSELDSSDCIIEELETLPNAIPRDKSDDIDFHFARVSQMNKDNISELEKLDIDTDISNVDFYEEEPKESETLSPTPLFATIGDVKKVTSSIDEPNNILTKTELPNGAERPNEFAVSRALGKYRLRKSSSISDDQPPETSPPKAEISQELIKESKEISSIRERKLKKTLTPEIVSSAVTDEMPSFPERSPSVQSSRGINHKFQPRHQQSLEIPNKHDDDDSRSTHSWRSGSRVSSRRQSTEDSIDSEDEWYCYELRKLEEMEHQSFIETERQDTLPEEPELEDGLVTHDKLKEQMGYVLRELKLKTAIVKKVCDESPKLESWKDVTTFPVLSESVDDTISIPEEDDDKSYGGSSGETSGPDSPVQSGDEYDDYEDSGMHVHKKPDPASSSSAQQDAPAGSKWKLLKALKDRKADEKPSETPVATTPSTEKDKVSAGVSYLMQKFYEIRVKS